MRKSTMWVCVVTCGVLAIAACSSGDDEEGAVNRDDAGTTSSGGSSGGGGGSSGTSGGGSSSGASGGGDCTRDLATETFGFTDGAAFANLPVVGASSLPANARANSGRVVVDACGIHLLAELDHNYSIHSWVAGAAYVQKSTADVNLRSIVNFLKIGDDFAVVGTDGDNHTYLYRMPGAGGALQKVQSEPLPASGDFGMQSISRNQTHLFFNSWIDGNRYALRRAPIEAFATGTLPLAEPMVEGQGMMPVIAWADQVAFGNKHYPASCATACTETAEITDAPNLAYAIGGAGDTLYGWEFGHLITRGRSAARVDSVPAGIDAGDDPMVRGSISADGKRVVVVTSGPSGVKLHRIDGANTATPTGSTLLLHPDSKSVQDVWTNGRVVLLVTAHSEDTKPLKVEGIAWP